MDKILKFGGSSVGTPERIKNVIEIIKNSYSPSTPIAVVVSAFGGATDQLIGIGRGACSRDANYQKAFKEFQKRHLDAIQQLVPPHKQAHTIAGVEKFFKELKDVLEGVSLLQELSPKSLDLIMSFGERLSAYIISEAIQETIAEAKYVDARELIKTDKTFGAAHVNFEETNQRIQKYFQDRPCLPIITGFIGSTKEEETTTLGRGGSDFTASILGAALEVKIIEIWTDVDGVMTADPRKEPYAFPIPEMSYKEAMEMSHFGAKVIHPPTLIPAMEKQIPLLIKNSFNPAAQGTLIGGKPWKAEAEICGISSIDQAVLFCLQGTGIVGVCGIAKRLFGALAEKGISIILISQGSSEHSICFAISPGASDIAKESIQKEFALEMQAGLIEDVSIAQNLSVIAVVGEKMCQTPGIAGKLFGALGKNGINLIAIAQGSSELNISFVVKKEDEIKSIRVSHEAFFLSPIKTLNLFLVGTGLIGGALLQEIQKHAEMLKQKHMLDIHLIGLADSRAMTFDPRGIPIGQWRQALEHASETMEIGKFVEKMRQLNCLNPVFVDCTSSPSVAEAYGNILDANISIVTPNKKANSSTYENYKQLKKLSAEKGTKFLYGSNVGAGLPIISTLNELIRSGDKILKIEAILSGTLSYLFNTFSEGKPFSAILQDAQKKGYTEPDPRDDLNGMDIARKLLILARESEYPLEIEDVKVETFLPETCFQVPTVEEFFTQLKRFDETMTAKRENARKEQKVLRYIAVLENGKGHIALQAVSASHPFYHLSGNDNIIAITSEFYRDNPLVIKGPGAGAKVTAGKVFGDIVQLGTSMRRE